MKGFFLMPEEVIRYQTRGTCCRLMEVAVRDGVVLDARFHGGCQGNLAGVRALITGMKIDEVIERLKGIDCGGKGTSCPDQLAICLAEYKARNG